MPLRARFSCGVRGAWFVVDLFIFGGVVELWLAAETLCVRYLFRVSLHTNIEAARREKSACGKAPSHYTYVLLRTEVHRIILRCASQFPHPHKSTFLMHSLGHLKRTLLILDLLLRRLEYSLRTERWWNWWGSKKIALLRVQIGTWTLWSSTVHTII